MEIQLWGQERLDFLRRFLPYEPGIPSHDTLGDVLAALDPDQFKHCFTTWVESLRDDAAKIIAIDGKTSRRSHARSKGREPLHLVSGWASRQRLVLAQEAVADKSNEIVAIPLLLQRLELTGALVTIDAIGTQIEIARTITRRGGDYLLALKASWPMSRCSSPTPETRPTATFTPQSMPITDHGRLEERQHRVCQRIDWLRSDRRYPDERRFPALTTIAMVQATTERNGKISEERRYYLSSAWLDAKAFAGAVRAHWGIDVVIHDDPARLRTGNAPQNMAIVKHIAMNLIRHPKDKHSLKNRRTLAVLNNEYLESLIRNQPAST